MPPYKNTQRLGSTKIKRKEEEKRLKGGYKIGKVVLVGNVEFPADACAGHFNTFNGLTGKRGYFAGIHIEADK